MLELLVVMIIIAILAGLLFPAIRAVRRHTREVVAKTEVKSIETAWKQYYTQYKKWPTFAEETDIAITGEVARVLQGEYSSENNPRKLKFMEFSRFNSSADPVNPWWLAKTASENYCYYVKFDTDYDGWLKVGVPPTNMVRRSVIVWTINSDMSPGEDGYIIGSWRQ